MSNTKNGGYVIIDISKEDFSGTVTRPDIYAALQINGTVGKPVLIYPKAGVGGVFAQVAEDSGTYTIGFTDAGGYMGTVIVSSDGEVRRTYTEIPAESEVSALDDRVDALEERVGASTLSSGVDISSYTSSSPYTPTKDGYLFVSTGTQEANVVGGIGATPGAFDISVSGREWNNTAVFVRKGSPLWASGEVPTGAIVQFFPLS